MWKTYKINDVDLSGANLNYSAGVTINIELYSKQDTLTFEKNGNSLKLQENVLENELLLAGSSDVIGLTKAETQSFLEITDTAYTNGTNITIDGNNAINLDTDLTSVNSISSVNNTDLKLKATGTGDILLKANAKVTFK